MKIIMPPDFTNLFSDPSNNVLHAILSDPLDFNQRIENDAQEARLILGVSFLMPKLQFVSQDHRPEHL